MRRRETHSGRHNYKGARYTVPAYARRISPSRDIQRLTETSVEPKIVMRPEREIDFEYDPFAPGYSKLSSIIGGQK